jgi:hypothetical protein
MLKKLKSMVDELYELKYETSQTKVWTSNLLYQIHLMYCVHYCGVFCNCFHKSIKCEQNMGMLFFVLSNSWSCFWSLCFQVHGHAMGSWNSLCFQVHSYVINLHLLFIKFSSLRSCFGSSFPLGVFKLTIMFFILQQTYPWVVPLGTSHPKFLRPIQL